VALCVTWLLTGAGLTAVARAETPLDRAKVLRDPGVYGLIVTYKLREQAVHGRAVRATAAVDEVRKLRERHASRVMVEAYLSRGLDAATDYFLRLHTYELAHAQDFLEDFGKTTIGRQSRLVHSFKGVTKGPLYISRDRSPELNRGLTSTFYQGPPARYAIVIPTRKNADWWNLAPADRLKAMEVHTRPTLAYLKNVRRKLYHSTGLDDADFLTYFETADLVAFHQLNLALVSVPENRFNVRFGNPTIVGTMRPFDEVMRVLVE
jgi:chlorite dismutase